MRGRLFTITGAILIVLSLILTSIDYPVEAVSPTIDNGKRIPGTIMLNPNSWRMPSNASLK